MLARARSLFARSAATNVTKASVRYISGSDWFCVNKSGNGCVLSTSGESAATPVDSLLMAYGACAASCVKFLLEKEGRSVRSLVTDVTAEWEFTPRIRVKDINLHVKIDADGPTQAQVEKIIATIEASMCPVHQTLKAGLNLKRMD
jgi:uncharacterized OsmC-like protein